MKRLLVKYGMKLLKNKKFRTAVIIAAVVGALFSCGLAIAAISVPITGLGFALNSMTSFVSYDTDTTGLTETQKASMIDTDHALSAYKNGFKLTSDQEASMRISDENFEYLIQRCYDYNHAGERSREITLQGQHTYVTSSYDATTKTTTTEEHTETIKKTVTVDNSMYEGITASGIAEYDYRLLFYFCTIAAMDRKTSDKTLSSVKPLDKDFMEITGYTKESSGHVIEDQARLFITKEDIDKVFTYTSINYKYYFDVLRDDRDEYTLAECNALPHNVEMKTDGDDTYLYYIPASYLTSGRGAWCTLENIKDDTNLMVTGVKCKFNYAGLKSTCQKLNENVVWETDKDTWKNCPGGVTMYNRLTEYGAINAQVEKTDICRIVIKETWDVMGSYSYGFDGYYSTIGEAAVAWALNVSCHYCNGENSTLESAWKYSQDSDERVSGNATDCSGLVYRAYSGVGLVWPWSFATTVTFYNYFSTKPETVICEHSTGEIPLSSMQPGDVIMIPRAGHKEMDPTGNNHIVIYAGDGWIVHAASGAGHVHYQPLSEYASAIKSRSWFSVYRPYIGLQSTKTYTTYSGSTGLDGETLAELAQTASERDIADVALYFAVNDAKTSKILPSVTAAQMLLESGWLGKLQGEDINGNPCDPICKLCTNYFGMKTNLSGNTWNGSTWDQSTKKSCPTWEEENGETVRIYADFRVYTSVDASVADHSAYLKGAMNGNSKRYPNITTIKNYSELAQHIKDGGYATDSGYATKVAQLIEQWNLNKYDSNYESVIVSVPSLISGYMNASSSPVAAASKAGTDTISWNSSWNLASQITTTPPAVTRYTPENGNGYVVFLNAGHGGEGKSMESQTPNDPLGTGKNQYNSSAGYTSGSSFSYNGSSIPESKWNYDMSVLIKDRLLAKGYTVVLARTSDSKSATYPENAARSVYANNCADIHVAIHFNSEDTNPFWYRPDSTLLKHANYSKVYEQSKVLGESIESSLCQSLGFSQPSNVSGFLTGYAWSTIPVVYIEVMGRDRIPQYMNRNSDIADAFVTGIDNYFSTSPTHRVASASPSPGGVKQTGGTNAGKNNGVVQDDVEDEPVEDEPVEDEEEMAEEPEEGFEDGEVIDDVNETNAEDMDFWEVIDF